ncbi:hypothetical protein [Arthrobacter sp. NPDC056727]|uniref:hypothetical protein n=1 Tax=Arthrobacter sp. NPDC056727 TaxID=3345927 RepID=UPI00366D5F9E
MKAKSTFFNSVGRDWTAQAMRHNFGSAPPVLTLAALVGRGVSRPAESMRVSATHFDDFLREAVSSDPGSERGLSKEAIFGLYTSWCTLSECPAESEGALWEALLSKGIDPRKNTLAMTGPAAADYILSSAPNLP